MAGSSQDDWVLDSLDKYERLHVFELPEPTLCMEWSRDSTAFYVAGYSQERRNELLKLQLPEKLVALDKQTLLARRDFKIACGAISKQPIYTIQCLEQTKNVVITSGLGSGVTVWGYDPASPDLLVATGNITTPTSSVTDPNRTELQISWSYTQPDSLLTGNSLSTLQSVDLNTYKPTWQRAGETLDDQLHALKWLTQETETFLTCSGRGELRLWDLRQAGGQCVMKLPLGPSQLGPSNVADKDGSYGMAVCGHKCVSLSNSGSLQLQDLREGFKKPLACTQLPVREKSHLYWSQPTPPQGRHTRPSVQFSELSNELSVSGVGGGVTVYDITCWNHAVENPSPIFTHTGHEADAPECVVTVHSWHPSFHSMIVSCDSEGTMHAWQWHTDNH